MLLCSTCIEKIIPPYTYKKEQYVNHFCYDCNCETSHIEYEVFKNKLFDVISKNYRFLKDLPGRESWFYHANDEDGVYSFLDFIEAIGFDDELTNKLLEDGEFFENELLVLYDDSLEEYEGCYKELEWEEIQENFKHKFRFFNSPLKDFLEQTFEYILDHQKVRPTLLNIIEQNTIFYRGRSFDSLKELLQEINSENLTLEFEKENETIAKNIRDKFGLVPSYLASDQRMTPFGISALYLSTQKMACVAEIRALVGQYVGVAQFSNRIELKLLNLNKLANGFYPHHLDENYLEKLDAFIFFKKLIASISKPKLESGKFDYLISQYFFEFLRVKLNTHIDGVYLQSIQMPSADNIILFPEVMKSGIDSSKNSGIQPIYLVWDKSSFNGVSISKVKSIEIQTEIEYMSHPRFKGNSNWI